MCNCLINVDSTKWIVVKKGTTKIFNKKSLVTKKPSYIALSNAYAHLPAFSADPPPNIVSNSNANNKGPGFETQPGQDSKPKGESNGSGFKSPAKFDARASTDVLVMMIR